MPATPGRDAVYAAAARWRDTCLIGEGSIFSSQRLWTNQYSTELLSDLAESPDEGDGHFLDQLRDQLGRSSKQAAQLAAEMLWVMMLFPTSVRAEQKANLVRTVWEWSGEPLPNDDSALRVLAIGIGSGGSGYNGFRSQEFELCTRFVVSWTGLSEADRRRLLGDSWSFAAWFDGIQGARQRQFRHMLLHLLFRNDFERISSRGDKRRVDKAFASRLPKELPANERGKEPLALDRRLARLRRILEAERPNEWVDYYENPAIRADWKPESAPDVATPVSAKPAPDSTVESLLQDILNEYVDASMQPFPGTLGNTLRRLEASLRSQPALAARPSLRVTGSFGKGNWAAVPWIAILDPRETRTTQQGVYIVFLFREDMSGVYVTFNQGVTEPRERLGRVRARQELQAKAAAIRQKSAELGAAGFATDNRIDLRASGSLGRNYEDSTIAYKLYPSGNVPAASDINRDLSVLIAAYDNYVTARAEPEPSTATRSWVFQGNPDYYDLQSAVRERRTISFEVRQHADEVQRGDRVFLWQSGVAAGVLAVGSIEGSPQVLPFPDDELPFVRDRERFDKPRLRAWVEIESVLQKPLLRRDLLSIPGLRELAILRGPQGTNFRVTTTEAELLLEMLGGPSLLKDLSPPRLELDDVVDAFAVALVESNLTFSINTIRTFVASLATKPFVILTGLSGSGKTQLALRFGQWCGPDRYCIIPVRPDWTGPEYLIGYEDALLPSPSGRRAWQVPDALRFMLAAAADPEYPYVLVLDEMNLAHVERYFADVLSGIESGEPCLPNLVLNDGYWRAADSENPKIRFPDNLFVVGTVNVDETTFMFSPKVLDRANTIEFRIQTSDLTTSARRPKGVAEGPDELVRGFLEISRDPDFHLAHAPLELDEFEKSLRALHLILAGAGFEFGHRTFYEAVRFAGIFAAAGDTRWQTALDRQLLQKLLPRLHGTRRKLEPLVKALEAFCQTAGGDDGTRAASPALPESLLRLRILGRALQANQFAGFIE